MLDYPNTKNQARGTNIDMLAEYKKKANIGVGLGFLLWIVLPICGAALLRSQQLPSYFRFLFPALLWGEYSFSSGAALVMRREKVMVVALDCWGF